MGKHHYSQAQISPNDTVFFPSDVVTWGNIKGFSPCFLPGYILLGMFAPTLYSLVRN